MARVATPRRRELGGGRHVVAVEDPQAGTVAERKKRHFPEALPLVRADRAKGAEH